MRTRLARVIGGAACTAVLASTLAIAPAALAKITSTLGQTFGLGNCTSFDPTIPPATSDTAASPASAGRARWVRRRRRSEGRLFTGGGTVLGEPRPMVPAPNSLNPP